MKSEGIFQGPLSHSFYEFRRHWEIEGVPCSGNVLTFKIGTHARTELVLEGSRSGWIQNRAWYGFDGRWHLACSGGPFLGTI